MEGKQMRIEQGLGLAYIYTPYNYEFAKGMRSVNRARWNERKKVWVAPAEFIPQIRDIMYEAFGETDIAPAKDKRSIKLRFTETVYEKNKPVTILGKTVARAYERDSGAKVGTDVAFIHGTPTSGGSTKYWMTVIPAGCVAVLHNVPAGLLSRRLPDGVVAEQIEDKADGKVISAAV